MEFRNRIVELRRVRASELRRNAKNWRQHPEGQRSALLQMLNTVGFVGAAIGRDTADGIELIDGHLRADLSEDAEMPVLIVDLNETEAKQVLATFDPLSALAIPDVEAFKDLLSGISLDENAEIRRMIADLHGKLEKEVADDPETKHEVEGMSLEPHEHYDYLVVLASTTQEWNVLCDRMGLEPTKRRGRMGTCRAVRASALLELLPARKQRKAS